MNTIEVNCSRSYKVFTGNGILNQLPKLMNNLPIGDRIFLISDDNVDKIYAKKVKSLLSDYKNETFILAHGEGSKNIDNLYAILKKLADQGFKRNDTILALGGGVVGDIAGLSASLYMRGIHFVQIPTTLLAMVDASIGGKTAVDLEEGKNLVGTFYQPLMVLCDTDIIRQLPKDIFREGMAEVIKYNIISDCNIISHISEGTFMDHLDEVINDCISIKARIVSEDEYEKTGLRKLLNAGHTFAHSLENLSSYQISHGNAVGTGLVYEAALAKEIGLCDEHTYEIIKNSIQAYDLLIEVQYSPTELASHMKLDKKNEDDLISFVLPERLGHCISRKLSLQEVTDIYSKIGVIR